LIDRVFFVSEFQANALSGNSHHDVPSMNIGNYIDPDDYGWHQRTQRRTSCNKTSLEKLLTDLSSTTGANFAQAVQEVQC
jgi:hypothetical protein